MQNLAAAIYFPDHQEQVVVKKDGRSYKVPRNQSETLAATPPFVSSPLAKNLQCKSELVSLTYIEVVSIAAIIRTRTHKEEALNGRSAREQ